MAWRPRSYRGPRTGPRDTRVPGNLRGPAVSTDISGSGTGTPTPRAHGRASRPAGSKSGARVVSPSEGNETRRDERQGVGASHSTDEAGEPNQGTPRREGDAVSKDRWRETCRWEKHVPLIPPNQGCPLNTPIHQVAKDPATLVVTPSHQLCDHRLPRLYRNIIGAGPVGAAGKEIDRRSGSGGDWLAEINAQSRGGQASRGTEEDRRSMVPVRRRLPGEIRLDEVQVSNPVRVRERRDELHLGRFR